MIELPRTNKYNSGNLILARAVVKSTITERGQTVIPAAIRRRFNLGPSDRLEWIVDSQGIHVVPVRADPIDAFRGRGTGGAVQRLLQDRREERAKDTR
ncbi:MAG: AbrB/MazE/SpoVT family DNA-binding domain-containing protein [Gammaproteobacteria bacterium]